jgi:hypothetical protein
MHSSGASRREIAKLRLELKLEHRHCERSEAIHTYFLAAAMDCFASLAMTAVIVIVRECGRPQGACRGLGRPCKLASTGCPANAGTTR